MLHDRGATKGPVRRKAMNHLARRTGRGAPQASVDPWSQRPRRCRSTARRTRRWCIRATGARPPRDTGPGPWSMARRADEHRERRDFEFLTRHLLPRQRRNRQYSLPRRAVELEIQIGHRCRCERDGTDVICRAELGSANVNNSWHSRRTRSYPDAGHCTAHYP